MDTTMDDATKRLVAVDNLAAWHDVSVRALGLHPTRTDRWWTCATAAPNIYHTAISLRPGTDERDRARMVDELRAGLDRSDTAYASVCDAWDELSLRPLRLRRRSEAPWCWRPAGPLAEPTETTRGLFIERVDDRTALKEFEATVVRGFEARPPVGSFEIHAPDILDDPSMHAWIGRLDSSGEPVAVSMAYVTSAVVGIYGVAAVPRVRRRGFATAMTRAALEIPVLLDRPAALQPSAAALGIYRRLDFVDIGWFSHWT